MAALVAQAADAGAGWVRRDAGVRARQRRGGERAQEGGIPWRPTSMHVLHLAKTTPVLDCVGEHANDMSRVSRDEAHHLEVCARAKRLWEGAGQARGGEASEGGGGVSAHQLDVGGRIVALDELVLLARDDRTGGPQLVSNVARADRVRDGLHLVYLRLRRRRGVAAQRMRRAGGPQGSEGAPRSQASRPTGCPAGHKCQPPCSPL